MKVMISNFYNIRFFTPNMLPLSTAVSGPQWYHDFKGPDHVFKDKRMVINGLVINQLVPSDYCSGYCRGDCDPRDPKHCEYLRRYAEQLHSTSFDSVMYHIEVQLARYVHFDDPVAVLMVYEKSDNPCSERWPLIDWFNEHQYNLKPFERPGAEVKPRKLFAT